MPTRSADHEYLDDHQPPQDIVDRIYRFLAGVNRYLGGTRATIRRFDVLSRGWPPGAHVSVLDVACGAADVPRGLVAWGRARGFNIHVTALDLSVGALSHARGAGDADGLSFVCADVERLPYRDNAFDYVTCALFFHHLTDTQIVAALKAFSRIAKRGLVINDLIRSWRAYAWIRLFTLPAHPILRNDGPLSVKRALRPRELARLAQSAGLPWLSVERHFGHRMTLAGEREPMAASPTAGGQHPRTLVL